MSLWRCHRQGTAFALLLVTLNLLVYGKSWQYGLIWDDPMWYSLSQDASPWVLLTSFERFQFYRPLTMLVNRALVSSELVVHHQVAHLLQIGTHTALALLVVPALRCLGLERTEARLGALLFSVHPFAYQAVAWQAPQQPTVLLLLLTALLCAESYGLSKKNIRLCLSILIYVLAILFNENSISFAPVLMLPWWRRRGEKRGRRASLWGLAYPALAALWLLIWLQLPRKEGITGGGLDLQTLAFMLQGVVFPLAAAAAWLGIKLAPAAWCGLLASGALVLAVFPKRREGAHQGLLALGLVFLAILPIWVGLSWPYVKVGSRLFYPAMLGTCMLWGRWLAWPFARNPGVARRTVGAAMVLAVVALAMSQLVAFDRLYALGTGYMRRTVEVMASRAGERLLFVNYPDRIGMRQAPYPLGYWGIILAPVSQDLAGFGQAMAGVQVETQCLSHFVRGAQDREQWTYRVDMRGEDAPPLALVEQAQWADVVLVTDYRAPGVLDLVPVGSVSINTGDPPLAVAGDALEVISAQVSILDRSREISVELVLRPGDQPQTDDTLFVHVLSQDGRLVAGRDGDALGDLIPMVDWPEQWLVTDQRTIDCAEVPAGRYVVTMGCYNRGTGQRHAAYGESGRLWDDEIILGTVDLG